MESTFASRQSHENPTLPQFHTRRCPGNSHNDITSPLSFSSSTDVVAVHLQVVLRQWTMSVERWIEDVISQTSSSSSSSSSSCAQQRGALSTPCTIAPPQKRRRSAARDTAPPRKRARAALQEITHNAAIMPSPWTPSGMGKGKARGKSRGSVGNTPSIQEAHSPYDSDLEATPRASILRPPPPPGRTIPPPPEAPRTGSPSKASTSSASGRSSPRKKPADLRNLHQPILQQVASSDQDVPAGVLGLRDLWAKMDDVADGVGILPVIERSRIQAVHPDRNLKRSDVYDETMGREMLGDVPEGNFVAKMTRYSGSCIEDNASEHAWNSFVHGPLLTEAFWLSATPDAVDVTDVSTATIAPASLLPWGAPTHKVDYAIVLRARGSPRLSCALQQLDPLDGADPSFNALADGALASSPICVGIEAKPSGEGGVKAGTQLSVWACATLNRMRRLAAQCGRPPTTALAELPLLIAQGESWAFRVATVDEHGVTTVWHHPRTLGNTATAKGVYQVTMALQVLAEWVSAKWKPWFKECLLPAERRA